MIVKVLLTFDYNPETNEFTPISKEIVKEETKRVTPKQKEETLDPQITLESNKYCFNQAAADLVGVKWEDRVAIQYQQIDGLLFPVIGKSESFKTPDGGNKVTKALTVSCRGGANERLSKYGNVFTLTKMKDKEGIFVLVGNAERPDEEIVQDEVVVPELDDIDIPLDTNLDDELAFEITDDTFKD